MSEMIVCKICGQKMTYLGLGSHLRKHNLKTFEYYDKYLKIDPNEGFCKVCGKPTKFRDIHIGYSKYHNICSAKDPEIQQMKKNNYLALCKEEQNKKYETKIKKYKETCLEKFGKDNYFKTEEFQIKREQTCLDHFGVSHHMKSENIKIKFRKVKVIDETIYPFYCEFCGKGFRSKKAIGKHLQVKNKITNCRQKYFEKYSSIENLPWNAKIKCKKIDCNNMVYPGGKTGFCHKCATKVVVKDRIRNAKLTTKKLDFINEDKVNWECEFCSKSFDTKGELENHAKDKSLKCSKLFYQKYRIAKLFPWSNYEPIINCRSCGIIIHSATKSGLCKKCSNQLIVKKYQLGNLSYQKILDVYNKFYTKKFHDPKFRLLIRNEQLICPLCGKELNKLNKIKKIHLHHIDFNKLNDDRQNLVFLCNSCHPKTNWNRTHFKNILEQFNYNLIIDN